jgi:hypothetical protein
MAVNTNVSFNLSETLYKRFEQPFVLSFIISAVAINWRFFYILLTTFIPVPEGLNRMDFAWENVSVSTTIIHSLIVATIYSLLIPIVNLVVSTFTNTVVNIDTTIKSAIDSYFVVKQLKQVTKTKQVLRAKENQMLEIDNISTQIYKKGTSWDIGESQFTDLYEKLNKKDRVKIYEGITAFKLLAPISSDDKLPEILDIDTEHKIKLSKFAEFFLKKHSIETD